MEKEELAQKVSKIEERVSRLEKKLSTANIKGAKKRMLTTEEAATFLGITVDGLRGLTHKKLISYYKPNGKNMYFDIDELSSWQKKNHFEPIYELEAVVQRSSK